MPRLLSRLMLMTTALAGSAVAEDVNLDNLVRAETDSMIRVSMAQTGLRFGSFNHERNPTVPEHQPVIRMNQDTLYSATVLDLSEPVTITLPDVGGRYMSMQVINQDHYMFVESAPGSYRITQEDVGTRFASVIVRVFVDVNDAQDIALARKAQDGLTISGGGTGPFEAPDWNVEDLATARAAVNELAVLGFDASHAFGREGEVRSVDHLVGAMAGWGGMPPKAAVYLLDAVPDNDGATAHRLRVRDVPVDAFWSVTVYNADGYLEANEQGINSLNNLSAEAADDGSYTLHFGACDDGRSNCIPITEGWNYGIRLYQPREEILDGSWTFPAIEPISP